MTIAIVCVPLGGTLAGLLGIRVLPLMGWRMLFVVGGLVPLIAAVALRWMLPESPQFFARRPARWPELVRVTKRMGHTRVAHPRDACDPRQRGGLWMHRRGVDRVCRELGDRLRRHALIVRRRRRDDAGGVLFAGRGPSSRAFWPADSRGMTHSTSPIRAAQYSTRIPSWISRAPVAAVGLPNCAERRSPMWPIQLRWLARLKASASTSSRAC